MPLVKRVRSRGATTLVQANAEVLWPPSGAIGIWANRLSNAVTRATIVAAPSNKRPRWDHYGKPLKDSFTSSSRFDVAGMKIHTVVGSRARYSAYPDQGTGVYAGSGAYPAKILPPWVRGGADLYESTFRAGPNGPRAPERMIRGQKGQFFFAEGLKRGLISMRIPSVEVPDAAVAGKARPAPVGLISDVLGNTPNDLAFQQQLEKWRADRDRAFQDPRRARVRKSRALGHRPAKPSRAQKQANAAASSRKYRANQARRRPTKTQPVKPTRTPQAKPRSIGAARSAFKAAMVRKYGSAENIEVRGGYFYATVPTKDARGRTIYKEVRGKIR